MRFTAMLDRFPTLTVSAVTPASAGVAANIAYDKPVSEFGYWVAANTWMSLGDWGVVAGIVIGVAGLVWRVASDRKHH